MESQAKELNKIEKIAKARELKDQGNQFYKEGNLRSAIKRYHMALLYLKGAGAETGLDFLGLEKPEASGDKGLEEEIKKLEFSCHNNLAACFLKKQNYEKVVDYSTKALDHQPDNVKALFRRGQAYFELKSMDKAKEDFEQITKLDPNESSVRKYTAAIEAEEKVQRVKEKEMYSAMFQKMSQSS